MLKGLKNCRYLSVIITSCVYLAVQQHYTWWVKGLVVIAMVLAAFLSEVLIEGNVENADFLVWIGVIETVGNTLILIVTGGFGSPYLWYCLNTVIFIELLALKQAGRWIALVYLVGATFGTWLEMQALVNYTGDVYSMFSINVVVGYLVIVMGIELVVEVFGKIEEQSIKLKLTNGHLEEEKEKVKKTLEDITKMYEVVNILTVEGHETEIHQLILDSIIKTQQTRNAVIVGVDFVGRIQSIQGTFRDEEIDDFLIEVIKTHSEQLKEDNQIHIDFKDKFFIIKGVNYAHHLYGVVVVEDDRSVKEEMKYKLDALSKIVAVIYKKNDLEKVSKELVISEEQNRIGNEIHDTIIQRLFASCCHIHLLKQQVEKQKYDQMSEALEEINQLIKKSMEELRETIYNLSWEKEGKDAFVEKISGYLEIMKTHQAVDIELEIQENLWLTSEEKVALYRILCELVNNALRHGKATKIDIQLAQHLEKTTLEITNNGKPFDYKKIKQKVETGVGLKNIYRLVNLLGGTIHWEMQEGVKVQVVFKRR